MLSYQRIANLKQTGITSCCNVFEGNEGLSESTILLHVSCKVVREFREDCRRGCSNLWRLLWKGTQKAEYATLGFRCRSRLGRRDGRRQRFELRSNMRVTSDLKCQRLLCSILRALGGPLSPEYQKQFTARILGQSGCLWTAEFQES
ncbi:hypothetical protein SCLCIDRAFT_684694 [Scleroderma citrinum Foug A]|uniref:Uncharacterized protein n=1 Tax=Scleroderma citrinum Foug A TaxID=1036808 RepID=A0A0C2YMX4_9AGAM|nr:hypothetical protein SCLCIDRAFT_684694 [Scleroderma citrinum Foug A]